MVLRLSYGKIHHRPEASRSALASAGSIRAGTGRSGAFKLANTASRIGRLTEVKMQATWQPHEKHGRLTEQSDLPDSVFAFPKQRKEPLTDASHVRNSIAFRPSHRRFRRRSRTGLRQYQEGCQVLWRRYDRNGLGPVGQNPSYRSDSGRP